VGRVARTEAPGLLKANGVRKREKEKKEREREMNGGSDGDRDGSAFNPFKAISEP
jgi:hypothetical protein